MGFKTDSPLGDEELFKTFKEEVFESVSHGVNYPQMIVERLSRPKTWGRPTLYFVKKALRQLEKEHRVHRQFSNPYYTVGPHPFWRSK